MLIKSPKTALVATLLGGGLILATTTALGDSAHFGPYASQGVTIAEAPVPELDHPDVREGIAGLEQFSMAFAAVADAVRPSVVSISVEKTVQGSSGGMFGPGGNPLEQFFGLPGGGKPRPVHGGGTGIVVSSDGYILTNNHVVDGADTITVRLADGREFDATPRGFDPKTDLAVIEIDAHGLSPATLGRSEDARVGEWVVAIGHPYSLDYTVTAGIVSAKGRSNLTNLVQYQDFIQTDASINPGNSGGPLVNLRGEVIGINTLIDGRGPGLGFAIPSDMVRRIMTQLIDTGTVVRPWLGVRIQDVDPALATALGYDGRQGAFIVSVEPDSPAEEAGLRAEDIIVDIDGSSVATSSDLVNTIVKKQVGQNLAVQVFRDGDYDTLRVKTAAMPEEATASNEASDDEDFKTTKLGIELRPMNAQIAAELGMAQPEGVVVWRVEPMGPASRAGLRRGDVILEVNRSPVATPSEVSELLAQAHAALFKIYRGGGIAYVAIDL